ncbi:NAD(P)/FAD-dependent oxidoreductase [Szabonella alba]|uniref:FAD-binding oxidoreductase n=1 Tax=Szabonella alba TaxID=2804194 RepID=A0A8K0Y0S4_9RHOB|nr:FAD-binding oxidoreductase [Szabonella alba]MBL4917147.1 FAD-binding oxidoreductase [Szabonella alba]
MTTPDTYPDTPFDRTALTHTGPLPEAVDVVVIGGGVIGVMAAWYLAEAGQSVLLCEKGRIAGEQSSRNWGWIRQQNRDLGELPVMVESLRLWKGLAQQLGEGLGFRQTGVTYLANSEADLAGFERWCPHGAAAGCGTVMWSKAETAARMGSDLWLGAMHTASDARAEPWVAVPLIARALAEKGVMIREGCAVRVLDVQAGRVTGVVTEAGPVRAGQVLLAGGAWSALLARAHGVTIPQLSVLASVGATVPMPEIHAGQAGDNHMGLRRRADGGYTIAPGSEHDFFIGPDAFRNFTKYLKVLRQDFRSTHFRGVAPKGYPDGWTTPRKWQADHPGPFEAMRILNPAPNLASLGRAQDQFARAWPALGRPKFARVWGGMIDTMPDVVPVVDNAPLPGLTIATGMSGHGFGIGPGMGRVLADLMLGRPTGHDLSRFRFSRFTDGSPIRPGLYG